MAEPHEPDLAADEGQVSLQTLGELFQRHREPLKLMVSLRLDHRLQGRVDPSDLLQEAYLEAMDRRSSSATDKYRTSSTHRRSAASEGIWLGLLVVIGFPRPRFPTRLGHAAPCQ